MISTIITTAIVINFAHFTKIVVWITGRSKFKFTACTLALQPHSLRFVCEKNKRFSLHFKFKFNFIATLVWTFYNQTEKRFQGFII